MIVRVVRERRYGDGFDVERCSGCALVFQFRPELVCEGWDMYRRAEKVRNVRRGGEMMERNVRTLLLSITWGQKSGAHEYYYSIGLSVRLAAGFVQYNE